MAFDGFKGSVEVSSGLVGPNGRDIPLMHVGSVQVGSDPNNRLSLVLDDIQERIDDSLTKDGGVVEGVLTLTQAPVDDKDAVNKKYIDEVAAKIIDSIEELEAALAEVSESLTWGTM